MLLVGNLPGKAEVEYIFRDNEVAYIYRLNTGVNLQDYRTNIAIEELRFLSKTKHT